MSSRTSREPRVIRRSLPNRMFRAAGLDGSLYAEVRADSAATAQAVTVVALVGAAHGLGTVVRALLAGWAPGAAVLVAVLAEVAFWAVLSFAVYFIGRHVVGATVAYGQVLRPLGFAGAPGLLILGASAASGLGADAPALAALALWRLAAYFVAVRHALCLGRAGSFATLVVGVAMALLTLVALTAAAWRVLEPA